MRDMRNFILFVLLFQLIAAFIRGCWSFGFMLGALLGSFLKAIWRGGVWLLGLVRQRLRPTKSNPSSLSADSVRPLWEDRPRK